jgi:hypothetical protein
MTCFDVSELALNIQVILPAFPANVAPFRAAFFGVAAFLVLGPGGVGSRGAGRSGTDIWRQPEASLSCSASFNVRSGRRRYGLTRGTTGLSILSSATKITF